MDNKRRVLLVIPNLGRGGAQQVFRDQFEFYSNHHSTMGCVFNWDDSFKDDHAPNIISLNVPAGSNFISKIFCFLRRVMALRKIKKAYNIDVCISHLEGADYVNLFSKRKEKIICWIHGSKSSDENIEGVIGAVRKKFLIPLTYSLSDTIITVSDGIRQELINHFRIPGKKIKTIYNSFKLEDIFNKAPARLDPPIQQLFDNKSIIITHCRLSRQKNLFVLIDIFKNIKDKMPVKLVLLGDGELRDELLNHCKHNNLSVYSVWNEQSFTLEYDVYFLGYERNPYPYLNKAALYIMTSSWEGFPLSLCEAMACSVPVISSDCNTGPREIIAPELSEQQPVKGPVLAKYGVLMPLASQTTTKIWIETLESVWKNVDLRKEFIENGKKRILAFDRDTISLQWLNLLG